MGWAGRPGRLENESYGDGRAGWAQRQVLLGMLGWAGLGFVWLAASWLAVVFMFSKSLLNVF